MRRGSISSRWGSWGSRMKSRWNCLHLNDLHSRRWVEPSSSLVISCYSPLFSRLWRPTSPQCLRALPKWYPVREHIFGLLKSAAICSEYVGVIVLREDMLQTNLYNPEGHTQRYEHPNRVVQVESPRQVEYQHRHQQEELAQLHSQRRILT